MPNVGAMLDDEETGGVSGSGPADEPNPPVPPVRGSRRRRGRQPEPVRAPEPPPQPWWRVEQEEEEGVSRVFWVYTDFDLEDKDVEFEGIRNVPGVTHAIMPADGAGRPDRGRRAVRVTHRAIVGHEEVLRGVIAALTVERSGLRSKRALRESERSRAEAKHAYTHTLFGVNAWNIFVWVVMLVVGFVIFGLGLTWNKFVWSVFWMGITWIAGITIRAFYLEVK